MRVRGALLGPALVLVLALGAPAAAGPPGSWTRLPGTVVNFAEPGLARTSDGTLHVVYVRKNGTNADLMHVPITTAGKPGKASVALGGWRAMNQPDLLRMPDGSLRVFFGGIRSTGTGEKNTALNTATAPASGATWTLQPGKAAQSNSAYSGATAGAGLAKDGTPISAWYSTGSMGFHYGTSPNDPDRTVPASGCCLYEPEIAVDSASGQAYIGFFSLERSAEGLYAQAISPAGTQGKRWAAPGVRVGKDALNPGGRTALTGRIGAAGVFMAHGQGYPTYKTVAVSRVGASKPQIVVKADRAEHINVAAAPGGRLWVMWEQNGTIYATRTNGAAKRIGGVNAIRPPRGATIYRLSGEGSSGPLDLVANLQAGGGQALWHQQILPKLQLTGKRAGAKIVFTVTDAGEPIAAANVKAAGRTLKTAKNGRATLANAPAQRVKASASKAGYAAATATVR
jgi:hypothetical protein